MTLVTDDQIWASYPLPVQAFRTMPMDKVASGDDPAITGRRQLAQVLSDKGYLVDGDIHVWGQDPFEVMQQRVLDGDLWSPDYAIGPQSFAATKSLPIPPGGIKTSLDAADYPATAGLDKPPAPLVGPMISPGRYAVTQAELALNLPDGYPLDEAGHWYVLHKVTPQRGTLEAIFTSGPILTWQMLA